MLNRAIWSVLGLTSQNGLFQDSKAYYNILNQVAPKGDEEGIPPIVIDISGIRVRRRLTDQKHLFWWEVLLPTPPCSHLCRRKRTWRGQRACWIRPKSSAAGSLLCPQTSSVATPSSTWPLLPISSTSTQLWRSQRTRTSTGAPSKVSWCLPNVHVSSVGSYCVFRRVDPFFSAGETREERTFRNWMNSLGVNPRVNHLYA